jgi:hypothetical protein
VGRSSSGRPVTGRSAAVPYGVLLLRDGLARELTLKG